MTEFPSGLEDEGLPPSGEQSAIVPLPVSARSTEHPWEEPPILPAPSLVLGHLPPPAHGRHARRRRPFSLVSGAAVAAVLVGTSAVALIDLTAQTSSPPGGRVIDAGALPPPRATGETRRDAARVGADEIAAKDGTRKDGDGTSTRGSGV